MTLEQYRGTLVAHVNAAIRSLNKLPKPHSEAITAALATLKGFEQKYIADPHADIQKAQQAISVTADALATFAVANAKQGVKDDVEAVITELRGIADLLRTAKELRI